MLASKVLEAESVCCASLEDGGRLLTAQRADVINLEDRVCLRVIDVEAKAAAVYLIGVEEEERVCVRSRC